MGLHNETGKMGESVACQYLIEKGYDIIEKNWTFNHKEIDIIAKNNGKIIFVEVKTRSNLTFELPKEAVTLKKQKNLVHAADNYLEINNLLEESRFDIISVLAKDKPKVIEHIQDAFSALDFL